RRWRSRRPSARSAARPPSCRSRAATSAPPAVIRPVAERRCRRCRAPLGIDDDVCEACGERNPVTMPWWGPLLGAAILLAIGYFLIDFQPMLELLGRVLGTVTGG